MKNELILVTGGTRAGKSDFALKLGSDLDRPVLFVATAEVRDEQMRERVERHRASRPRHWRTLEEPVHLPEAISGALQHSDSEWTVLMDCLNLWVSNLLLMRESQKRDRAIEEEVLALVSRLLDWYDRSNVTLILVTNEVGLGLVPTNRLGRDFTDILGRANQMVAAKADRVYLLVSGLPLELKSLSAK